MNAKNDLNAMNKISRAPLILCVGIAVRDLVFRVKAMPETGRKTGAESFNELSGGNAVNAAVGIARLGGRAAYCGPVGEDSDGLLNNIAMLGIATGDVVRVPGARTPVSGIFIDAAGERTIATHRSPLLANGRCDNSDALAKDCDALCVDNRFPDFALPICEAGMRRKIPVMIDVDRGMQADHALIRTATHVIFSAQGLAETSGLPDDFAALTLMAQRTSAFVAVTRGPDGVLWLDQTGELRHMPAFSVKAVDTLGAGDVFHGACTLMLAEGRGIEEALRFASAAAALKCATFGGAFATPARDEVERFLVFNS